MKLVKKNKYDENKNKTTRKKMRKLFNSVVDESKNYKLLYAYNMKQLGKNYYEYQNIIVGFDEENLSLVIILADKKLSTSEEVFKYTPNDIKKVTYNKKLDLFSVYKKYARKPTIDFYIFDRCIKDEKILSYIVQEDEYYDFKDFYKNFKKNRGKSIL